MLAIDWGTSSLRVYRLDDGGNVRETRKSANGILGVSGGAFAQTLESEAGDWIAAGDTPIVMSGMIGSRQGWQEAAYVTCPAMCPVQWTSPARANRHAWIAPGLRCLGSSGVNDVMRGEEVQILGIIDQLGDGEHHVCLPGTHSKWTIVRDGRIVSFSTHMTGETFAVLKQHSILGRTMATNEYNESAYLAGVRRAADPGGLLHHLFGVRAEVLADAIADTQSASYLSGILIGHELRAATPGIKRFHILGAGELTNLYALAATNLALETVIHETDAVTRGLFALAQNLNGSS
jgi:2-dehydro-3-deoxygalactonokinase